MEFGPEVHGRGLRQEILDFSENNLTLSVSKQRLPGLGVGGAVWCGVVVEGIADGLRKRWVCGRYNSFPFGKQPSAAARRPSDFTSDVPLISCPADSQLCFFMDSINQSKRCNRGEGQKDGRSAWCETQAAASELSRRRLHRPGHCSLICKDNRTSMLKAFFFFFKVGQ